MKNIRNKATSDNSGHTATVLRTSAQTRQSRTSYVRKTLGPVRETRRPRICTVHLRDLGHANETGRTRLWTVHSRVLGPVNGTSEAP